MKKDSSTKKIKLPDSLNLKDFFTPPTFEEWKTKVESDLKGALYEKKLITKTYEGIDIQPVYTQKDVKKLKLQNDFPGIARYKRASKTNGYLSNAWNINQEIKIADATEFNIALKNALANGQNSINLTLDSATKSAINADTVNYNLVGNSGVSVSTLEDLENVFAGIDLTKYPLIIEGVSATLPFLSLLIAFAKKKNINIKKLKGFFPTDIYAHLIESGKITIPLDCYFDMIKHNITWAKANSLKLKLIGVSTLPYANAGANIVQELAFAISTATDYINKLIEKKIKPNDILNNMVFTYGIGTNYFMEIAKFRAARVLWNNITEAYGIKKIDVQIFAKTSSFHQTVFDPYVNMLRATTGTFSAILGGVESITTSPFDYVFSNSNDFSRRIARNTQIILKEESHLDQVIDAAGGSYFVETLTKQLAEKAWKLFQTIETEGGMLNAIKTGYIHNVINNVNEKRKADINKRKNVIIGTNMFANIKEEKIKVRKPNQKTFQKKRIEYLKNHKKNFSSGKLKNLLKELNLAANSCSAKVIDVSVNAILSGATLGEITQTVFASKEEKLITPKLNDNRASEDFEKLRNISLQIKKKTGSLPKVFLANIGTLKDYKARADFSRGFFEVGGFDVIYSAGFKNIKNAVKEILNQKPDIVVISSTDKIYEETVPQFAKLLKSKNSGIPLILAGKPEDKTELYKISGIDEFIYLGADAKEILSSLLTKIGGSK